MPAKAHFKECLDSESNRKLGVCYAASFLSCLCRRSGYQRSKLVCKSSLSAWTRTCNRRCAPRGVHRICCFFTNRLATSWLIVDSTCRLQYFSSVISAILSAAAQHFEAFYTLKLRSTAAADTWRAEQTGGWGLNQAFAKLKRPWHWRLLHDLVPPKQWM